MNPLAALISSLTGASQAGDGAAAPSGAALGLFAQLLQGGQTHVAEGSALPRTGQAGAGAQDAGETRIPELDAALSALLGAGVDVSILAPGTSIDASLLAEAGTSAVPGEGGELPVETVLQLLAAQQGQDTQQTDVTVAGAPDKQAATSPQLATPAVTDTPELAAPQVQTLLALDGAADDEAAAPALREKPDVPAQARLTGLANAQVQVGDKPGAQGIENALARAGQGAPAPAAKSGAAPATPPQPQAQAQTQTQTPALPAPDEAPVVVHNAKPVFARGETGAGAQVEGPEGKPAETLPPKAEGANAPRADAPRAESRAPQPATARATIHMAAGWTLISVQERAGGDIPANAGPDGASLALQGRLAPASPGAAPPPAQASLPQMPVNALAVHIAQQAQNGVKRFDIRLDPPELGRMEIRLEVARDGQVTTHLVVERSETLDLLRSDARNLERALQNAGLDTSEGGLKFSLKNQDGGHEDPKAEGGRGGEHTDASDDANEDAGLMPPQAYVAHTGLDIRI